MANYADWSGMTAYDKNNQKVGTIADVYSDAESNKPDWITIKSGLFGTKKHFAPLAGSREADDGIMLAVTSDQVNDAPSVEADDEISDDEQEALYQHYRRAAAEGQSEGYDTSGPTTDDAMTRSEEEVNVGTRTQETGRVRLKKYVVTEDVQMTVPLQREEVRLEREPITEENAGRANDGPAISEEEHEVVLKEEVPVIEKQAVPKERIKLSKDTVTEEQTINEQVRKEQVDIDDPR